jgi:hypothetical protein
VTAEGLVLFHQLGARSLREMTIPSRVSYEQAVYGSFPFWDKGYALLARSPGCEPEWVEEFQAACRKYGEPTRDASALGARFSLRLASGPWLIVRVEPQGNDDRGRPGALAFHGMFVTHREFRKIRFDPFLFDAVPKGEWDREIASLPAESLGVDSLWEPSAPPSDEAARISRALTARRRIALEASAPATDLARAVWRLLSPRVRRRVSVTTLAFSNDNQFDFLVVPKLASVTVDDSYAGRPAFGERIRVEEFGKEPAYDFEVPRHWWIWLAAAFVTLSLLAIWLARKPGPAATPRSPPVVAEAPPERPSGKDRPPSADERSRVLDGLIDFAERYQVLDLNARAPDDPAKLMMEIADRLRYRGGVLSPQDLHHLRSEGTSDSQRALAMHAHILHFLPDHPLPANFSRGTLRWQLVTLAWSFHIAHDSRRKISEIPAELSEALAGPASLKAASAAFRFPEVAEYEKFLARLPRR